MKGMGLPALRFALLALVLAGCASTPATPAEAGSCHVETRYLTTDGWLAHPDSSPSLLDFPPGVSFVEVSLEFPVEPPIQPGYRFLNGSVSYETSAPVVANPLFLRTLTIRMPDIGIFGPAQMSAGDAYTGDFNLEIRNSTVDQPYSSADVSSLYFDPYVSGGVALVTHSESAPSYLQFTYC